MIAKGAIPTAPTQTTQEFTIRNSGAIEMNEKHMDHEIEEMTIEALAPLWLVQISGIMAICLGVFGLPAPAGAADLTYAQQIA